MSITDSGALELAAIDASDLTVIAGGAITQTATTAISATGLASFTNEAAAITLTETGNSFGSVAANTDQACRWWACRGVDHR